MNMNIMITAGQGKISENDRMIYRRHASCSFCSAVVMTQGDSVPESEIAGVDEKTGMLICRDCVSSYFGENLMTA